MINLRRVVYAIASWAGTRRRESIEKASYILHMQERQFMWTSVTEPEDNHKSTTTIQYVHDGDSTQDLKLDLDLRPQCRVMPGSPGNP